MQVLSSSVSRAKVAVSIGLLVMSATFANALTVSPARMELSGDPGKPITGKFLIINEQNSDQTFYTSVENFEAQGESGTPSFSPSKDGFASWVNVIDKVEIKKGDRLEIPFVVNIPMGADPGGHFAAIFLTTAPPTTQGNEVSIGAKVGMLMLLRVSGNIKEGGGVLSFALQNMTSKFATSLPLTFTYRFANNGNDRVNPSGSITIKNTFGMTSASLNANKALGNVLPNSVRRFDVTWGDSAPLPTTASFVDIVKYQYKNFALGMYTANLDLSFGTAGKDSKSITLYVIPWQLVLVVLVALAILWLIAHLIIKHHDKVIIQQLRRMQRRRE